MIFNRSERDNRFARAVKKSLVPLLGGAGALHFLKPEPFDGIVPPQLPGTQRTYTYVSGAAELATAALLAQPEDTAGWWFRRGLPIHAGVAGQHVHGLPVAA